MKKLFLLGLTITFGSITAYASDVCNVAISGPNGNPVNLTVSADCTNQDSLSGKAFPGRDSLVIKEWLDKGYELKSAMANSYIQSGQTTSVARMYTFVK